MTPQDSLAAYRFPDVEPRYGRDRDPRRTLRPLVTDAGGERHAAPIPSPVAMAEAFARPLLEQRFGTVYRQPGGALVTQDGLVLTQPGIHTLVLAAIMALPPREGLGPYDAYTGILRAVADDPSGGYLRRYALNVARACARRDVFPAPPAEPGPARPPRTAKTSAQWKADQRARERSAETQSARAWLELYLAEAEPGNVAAGDLYALASEGIRDYIDDESAHDDGTPWRVPGPRTFYAVADEILGPRRRGAQGVRHYSIPHHRTQEHPVAASTPARDDVIAEALLDRMARLAWEEQRATLTSYLERRDASRSHADNVSDLGAHRARRSA